MKKIILMAAVAVMTAISANAQENKFWVGGSFGFSSAESAVGENSYNHVNSFKILPEFGYRFSDRWAAGVRFGTEQAKTDAMEIDRVYQTSVAAFARHTFLTWKALSLFADGGLEWSTAGGTIDDSGNFSEKSRVWGLGLFVSPGFSLRLSDRFALVGSMNVFSAGYAGTKAPAWTQNETGIWAASLNSPFNLDNITLGFNFTF